MFLLFAASSYPYIGARSAAPKLTFKATEGQGDSLVLVLLARGGMVLTYHPFRTQDEYQRLILNLESCILKHNI
jgi:hypothetical protein